MSLLLLQEFIIIFLFVVAAAGVLPRGIPKKRPRTSSIVQFIFYFWSFEISRNILRNQKNIMGLDSYILNSLSCLCPVWVYFSHCVTSSLGFEVAVYYFLAFFASSFRVTEEDRLSETAVWSTFFLLNVSTALTGIHNYIFICYFNGSNSCTR